jgi:hypothetical protein
LATYRRDIKEIFLFSEPNAKRVEESGLQETGYGTGNLTEVSSVGP